MDVFEAVTRRQSVRAFLPKPVPPEIIARVLEAARRAPSNSNIQPQYVDVLTPNALKKFKDAIDRRVKADPSPDRCEYEMFAADADPRWNHRRFETGKKDYEALGIERHDRENRRKLVEKNLRFFDAPLAMLFSIDRERGYFQWADLGIYIQTIMVLFRGEGLDSCAQSIWADYSTTVAEALKWPANRIVYCGMGIGYADTGHCMNAPARDRISKEEYVTFHR